MNRNRRELFKFLVGLGVGTVVAELYERLFDIPALERSFKTEINHWMERYKEAEKRLEEYQARVNSLSQTLKYEDELEKESVAQMSIYKQQMQEAINGLEKTIEKYEPLLGEDRVAFESKTLDLLREMRKCAEERDKLSSEYKILLRDIRLQDPELCFGANFRAWREKDTEIRQLSAAKEMWLNCGRIFFEPWKYAEPNQALPESVRSMIKKELDYFKYFGMGVIFTFDKVMWRSDPSTKYWVGYEQYKKAILDVIATLKGHPALFAYDLSNEPILAIEIARVKGDITEKRAEKWKNEVGEVYKEMRDDILSIDEDVLITVGDYLPEYSQYFIDAIDFVSFHDTGMWSPYPERNTWDATPSSLKERLKQNIHLAKNFKKPVVLEEYGTDPEYVYDRQKQFLGEVKYQPIDYWRVILEVLHEENIGALFWVINIRSNDSWNLAVNDYGELTKIGEVVKNYAREKMYNSIQYAH